MSISLESAFAIFSPKPCNAAWAVRGQHTRVSRLGTGSTCPAQVGRATRRRMPMRRTAGTRVRRRHQAEEPRSEWADTLADRGMRRTIGGADATAPRTVLQREE